MHNDPSTTETPEEEDILGCRPLWNSRHEELCQRVAGGQHRIDAYMEVYDMEDRDVATTTVSRVFRNAHVRDRLNFLQGKAVVAAGFVPEDWFRYLINVVGMTPSEIDEHSAYAEECTTNVSASGGVTKKVRAVSKQFALDALAKAKNIYSDSLDLNIRGPVDPDVERRLSEQHARLMGHADQLDKIDKALTGGEE